MEVNERGRYPKRVIACVIWGFVPNIFFYRIFGWKGHFIFGLLINSRIVISNVMTMNLDFKSILAGSLFGFKLGNIIWMFFICNRSFNFITSDFVKKITVHICPDIDCFTGILEIASVGDICIVAGDTALKIIENQRWIVLNLIDYGMNT